VSHSTPRRAADIERLFGNTARERENLIKAQALFRAKGNVGRAREVGGRLPDLGADRLPDVRAKRGRAELR